MIKNGFLKVSKEATDYFAIGLKWSRIEKSRGQRWLRTNFSILDHFNRFANASTYL
jgi:hypothetical protein